MKSLLTHKTFIYFTAFVAIAVSSCSTRKNTFTRRAYHNLTAHYNAYFNGNESYKESVRLLEKAWVDNYATILPTLIFGNDAGVQAGNPGFEKAIKKASIVIQRHSMYFNNTEYCNWIDDAYMLMGKSQFYKKDYTQANQTFAFVTSRFSKNPIKYEAMLWLAKIAIIEKNYNKAQSYLDVINSRSFGVPKQTLKVLPIVTAELHLRQNNLAPASEQLLKAIALNKRKSDQIRLMFVLAQLYEQMGELNKASEYYRKVIRLNPPYEFAFHAKIFLARCFDQSNQSGKPIAKLLQKMLKDVKNKDYLDEIYFALAEIALKENQRETAIKYLKLSVAKSIVNTSQKAISSLKLADLYFEDLKYTPAQAYYDTAMAFLPKNYPNYDNLMAKKDILTDLVNNLQTVQREDSLQRLAAMSPNERLGVVNGIISALIAAEVKAQQEEAQRMNEINMLNQNRPSDSKGTGAAGQWYFYNSSALSFGFTEFTKKWGNRKLEDLWRLSNKQSMDFSFEETKPTDDTDTSSTDSLKSAKADPKKPEFYLKNIPQTPEQIEKSNKKIEEALFNLGTIYKDQLHDLEKAIESFLELEKRFPSSKFIPQAYYYLYKTYTELEYRAKAETYKNLLLTKFPESDYAKIIADPNYFKTLAQEKNKSELFYSATFSAYKEGNYETVKSNYQTALSTYKDKNTLARFAYLNALAIGKTQTEADYIAALEDILKKYPECTIKPVVDNALNVLKNKNIAKDSEKGATNGKQDAPVNSPYVFDPAIMHMMIVVADVKFTDINNLKNLFSDHNMQYHSQEKLTVSTMYLDNNRQVVSISSFENAQQAKAYMKGLQQDEALIDAIYKGNVRQYVISAPNYGTLIKTKDLDGYDMFFLQKYSN